MIIAPYLAERHDLGRYEVRRAPAAPDRPAPAWDALLPGRAADFYLCHDWLTSIRGTKGYADQTWSILDREQGLVALMPVYTAAAPVNNQLYDLFELFGGTQPGAPGRSGWAPQTLIGSRSGYTNAPMIRDGSLLPAWAAVARQAAESASSRSAAILYVEKSLARQLSALLPGSTALLCGGGCRITLQHDEPDAYLAQLSRSCRRIIRADLRLFARSDRTITTHQMDDGLAGLLAPLLANVQHRHGSSVATAEVAAYLRGCAAKGLGERSVAFICWHGGDAIGFSLAFQFGSSLTIRVVGLDYGRVGQHAEYFTLLVHEPVSYALAHGLKTVDLGAESFRAKLLRGGEFVPLWSLLLASPRPWEPETVSAHNARLLTGWREQFGDLVDDLDTRASLEADDPASIGRNER